MPTTTAGRAPHIALFSISGLIYAVSALQGDLANIVAQFSTAIPMIAGLVHLVYHEKQVAADAYNVGESAQISDVIMKMSAILSNASPDLNALKAIAADFVAKVKP